MADWLYGLAWMVLVGLYILWWQLDEWKDRRTAREQQRQAAVIFYRMEQRKQATIAEMRRIAREHRH